MQRLQIAFLFSFLLSFTTNAQIKPGFKLLNDKNYPKAAVKLEAAMQKPQDAPVARLGLWRIQDATQPYVSFEEIRSIYREISESHSAYRALPKERQQYFSSEKRIRIKDSDFLTAKKRLQQEALKFVSAEMSLELLDSLMLTMGPISSSLRGQLERTENELVMMYFHSGDYQMLRSVFKYHRHVPEKNGYKTESYKVSFRLLDAFLRERPLHEFPAFVADFPWHWVSLDCYIGPFLQAITAKSSAPLLNFLTKHPDSNLDNVVVHALNYPQNKYVADADDPGMKDLKLVSSIITGYPVEDLTSSEMQAKIKKYITAMAPSNRSYALLVAGLNALHTKGEYAKCAALVEYARPLFPDVLESRCAQPIGIINKKQAWFEESAKLLRAQDYRPAKSVVPSAALEDIHEFAPIISLDEEVLYFSSVENFLPEVKYTIESDSGWTVGLPFEEFGLVNAQEMFWMNKLKNAMLFKKFGKLVFKGYDEEEAEPMDKYLGAFKWKGRAVFIPERDAIIFEASLDSLPFQNDSDIDLYVISWSGSWSQPKRLPFNTPAQERLPYMHADGKTLFFTSNGLNSLGGQDLYSVRSLSKYDWEKWDEPQNLGKEINSFADDAEEGFSIPASGKYIYRVDPEDKLPYLGNICKVELPVHVRPTRVIMIKGNLNVIKSDMLIKAVTNVNSETPIAVSEVHPSGYFVLLLEDPGKEVIYLYAEHPLFYSTFVALDLSDGKDVYTLEKSPYCRFFEDMIKNELPFPMESVYFSPGSTVLSPEAKVELDWLAMNLKQRKQTILIAGHGEPSDAKNLDNLSLERAEVVKAYLIDRGMPWDRLWTMGFADKKPVGSPRPAVGPPVDKRVEVYFKTK